MQFQENQEQEEQEQTIVIYQEDQSKCLDLQTGELTSTDKYWSSRTPLAEINIPYSKELGEFILHKLGEQRRLNFSEVSLLSGVPSVRVIMGWLSKHEDFREGYEYMLQSRAIRAYERVEELSQAHIEKDEVGGARVNLDASKFLMERLDRKRFSSQQEKSESGLVINIVSGIERDSSDKRDIVDVISEIRELEGSQGE